MTSIAEKALKQLYDEYKRTGINDWQSINTYAGKELASRNLVKENVQGEFMLTAEGINRLQN